ncbi:Gfo/Idh/MocA family protein [Roseinatronobacter alkalisoli]|uniref:Gfo/Idh/MocA family oxidoreductase n=1 Tax=Roseinatronobacter alkalisoli TaxID=3028235 RepID=A0ABT5T9W1_9RHOB|nr:Gfo/Idh/MocA family oxidoreductase [Roseinatronobacter sp. HJB301]MDD7970967.1 Gfo/Idh/MocA family oxidoreductase [Roseinatronobacter sp. HJB301]
MRYAIVGCGSRHEMFVRALTGPFADRHQLVALCDSNPVRLNMSRRNAGGGVGAYPAQDFARMLGETTPDVVIVATPDHLHATYVIAALDAGCDVICEKPLTVDAASLRAITLAQARSRGTVKVTFNYRYAPARSQIRDLLADGAIGQVVAVNFRWQLDRIHGADYFRRWHRQMENSGGLQVHKCTHHFDLLNWWLDSAPQSVAGSGQRAFYTPQTAERYGLAQHGKRCTGCAVKLDCPFALDLGADARLDAMYRAAEGADGYHRDLCIFDPEITIEDTLQAHIRYASGAVANYTLSAYAPQEGLQVTFIGTEGELHHQHTELHGIFGGTRSAHEHEHMSTVLHRSGHAPRNIPIPETQGDHGGADPVMLGYLLAPDSMPDLPHMAAPDTRAGCLSVATGLALVQSISTGQTVAISDILQPDWFAMG